MAHIIDGRKHAAKLRRQITTDIDLIRQAGKRLPHLAVILVGDDPASQIYVANKIKYANEVGVISKTYNLDKLASEKKIISLIHSLNINPDIDAILVQLPLPKHLNKENILNSLDPNKDVDCLHPLNIGLVSSGKHVVTPCTPQGCIRILISELESLSGLHAMIIGRSNLVGKPLSLLLLQQNCTATIAHSYSKNLPQLSKQADIIIAAVGVPKLVTQDWVKKGAVVIDVGINRVIDKSASAKVVGDVDFHGVAKVASAITPVPGGVGPMTIACLLYNTWLLYLAANNKK